MTVSAQDLDRFETVSFGVFDTVLSRAVAFRTGVFDVLALVSRERLCGPRPKIPFAKARIVAEAVTRATSKHEEVTLAEIYERFGQIFRVPDPDLESLCTGELDIERDVSFGLPATIELARALRQAGKRVLFVADSCLPEDFVHELLARAGTGAERSDVFVSSRWRATKGTGRLFTRIAEREGLALAHWQHLGNCRRGDVTSPLRLGVSVRRVGEEGVRRYAEARICPRATRVWGASANPVSQVLAGALRRQRLVDSPPSADRDTRLGLDLVGPLLLPYVIWVLRESTRRGIDDVFFLARDGMVMKRIADAVARLISSSVRLRYLLVSRQSINLPTLGLPGVPGDWLLESNQPLTPRRLARRLDLDVADVMVLLRDLGLQTGASELGFSSRDVEVLRQHLPGSGLMTRALASGEMARRSALAFLRQQGVLGPDRVMLVDLGWRGTLQDRISDLAEAAGVRTRFAGLYLGRVGRGTGGAGAKEAFLFDTGRGVWPAFAGIQCIGLLETLTRAPHGTVMRYREGDEGHEAELDSEVGDFGGVERMHGGAVRYAESIPPEVLKRLFEAEDAELRGACLRVLLAAGFQPPADEADLVGRARFSGEQGETPDEQLAPPLGGWSALRSVMSMNPIFPDRRTFWLSASLLRGRSGLASGAGLLLRQAVVAASLVWSRLHPKPA